MEDLLAPGSIIELEPENLILVLLLEPTSEVIKIKVYELSHFLVNPDPSINEEQLAQYSSCPNCLTETLADIRDMYAGWSTIDKTQSTRLIGIHNQDPNVLYIQFSLGQRNFIYERCLDLRHEKVYEELFGKKHSFRQRALSREDEQYLISNLKFIPKTKRAISFYPQRVHSSLTRKRRHFLTHSC